METHRTAEKSTPNLVKQQSRETLQNENIIAMQSLHDWIFVVYWQTQISNPAFQTEMDV